MMSMAALEYPQKARRVRTPEEQAAQREAKLAKLRASTPSAQDLKTQEDRDRAEREGDRLALKAKAVRAGMTAEDIGDPEKPAQTVRVWTHRTSYYAMGFNAMQVAAAERFDADWTAAYRGLQACGFAEAVDHARSHHGPHLSMVDAQRRLQTCQAFLGERSWDIVVGVAVYGATSKEIHRMGGKDHVTVKNEMTVAFNRLDEFYTGRLERDRTWKAFKQFNAQREAMIREAHREVG